MKLSDNTAAKIGEMITEKLESINKDWKQPWVSLCGQEPQSLAKRPYNGVNAFLLSILQEVRGYETGFYLTMNKVNELGLSINKGDDGYEKPFPVFLWNRCACKKDGTGFVDGGTYDRMDEAERDEYSERWVIRTYNVFNVSQTNYKEKQPDKWKSMITLPDSNHVDDVQDIVLDYEIEGGGWCCPIKQTQEGYPCYSPSKDTITLPLRERFFSNTAFYGTALHEMTHSAGKLLGRKVEGGFGTKGYAKEELVAELSAAIMMADLGLEKSIDEEHLCYIKSWCQVLKDKESVNKLMNQVMDAVSYHHKMYDKAQKRIAA